MKKELIKLANHLDRIGLAKEADYLDKIIKNAYIEDMKSFLRDIGKDLESGWHTLSCLGRDKDEMPSTFVESEFELNVTTETVKCVCKRNALDNNGTEEDYKKCVQDWIDKAIRDLPPSEDMV